MEAKAIARHIRMSAQKLRLIADMVRGQDVNEATAVLKLTPKRGARLLGKVVGSAVANASQRPDVDPDNLFIKTIMVDEGPTWKRWRPRARGSASRIFKRTSHVTVILEER